MTAGDGSRLSVEGGDGPGCSRVWSIVSVGRGNARPFVTVGTDSQEKAALAPVATAAFLVGPFGASHSLIAGL